MLLIQICLCPPVSLWPGGFVFHMRPTGSLVRPAQEEAQEDKKKCLCPGEIFKNMWVYMVM